MSCECYGCKPRKAPDDWKGDSCSVCLLPMGGGFPNIPEVGHGYTICVDCAGKMSEMHKSPDKRDPVTRKWMITCTDAGCGAIVHRFNIFGHFVEKTGGGVGMVFFKAFADRMKEIEEKNATTKSTDSKETSQ